MPKSRYIIGQLPWYSFLITAGIILALYLASREEKRLGLKKDTLIDLALWVLPAGVIGARLYYVAFSWESYRMNLLAILEIWNGGIAIYGAILGGILAILLFSHFRRIPCPVLLDMIVPGLALAQAIGRWGNFFNMEAYGLPVTSPKLCFFPFAVQIPSVNGTVWHMATFFYESCWNFCIFLFLWLVRKKIPRHGTLTLYYAFLYGAGRSIIEGLRTDSLYFPGTQIRISQLVAVICVFASALVLLSPFLKRMTFRENWPGFLLSLSSVAIFILLNRGYGNILNLTYSLSALAVFCAFICRTRIPILQTAMMISVISLRWLILAQPIQETVMDALLMIPGSLAWILLVFLTCHPFDNKQQEELKCPSHQ